MEPWERQQLNGWYFCFFGNCAEDWDTGKNVWISSTSKDDIKFSGLNPWRASYGFLRAWAQILVAKASAHCWILKWSKSQCANQWSSRTIGCHYHQDHEMIVILSVIMIHPHPIWHPSCRSQEHATGAAASKHWHFPFPAHPNEVCGRQSHVAGPKLGCQAWLVLDVSWRPPCIFLQGMETSNFHIFCSFCGNAFSMIWSSQSGKSKIGNMPCRPFGHVFLKCWIWGAFLNAFSISMVCLPNGNLSKN